MKIAAISDIHGNLDALDAVLADIERDRWLSAEEAVEYGLVSRIIQRKTELNG